LAESHESVVQDFPSSQSRGVPAQVPPRQVQAEVHAKPEHDACPHAVPSARLLHAVLSFTALQT
jgi:hypothetical protein